MILIVLLLIFRIKSQLASFMQIKIVWWKLCLVPISRVSFSRWLQLGTKIIIIYRLMMIIWRVFPYLLSEFLLIKRVIKILTYLRKSISTFICLIIIIIVCFRAFVQVWFRLQLDLLVKLFLMLQLQFNYSFLLQVLSVLFLLYLIKQFIPILFLPYFLVVAYLLLVFIRPKRTKIVNTTKCGLIHAWFLANSENRHGFDQVYFIYNFIINNDNG